MKNICIYTLTLIMSIITLKTNAQTQNQNCNCSYVASVNNNEMNVVKIEPSSVDYSFTAFKNLSSFLEINNIEYDQSNLNERGTIVEGNGDRIQLYAEYNKNGDLVTSRLVKKDTPLPKSIYRHLVKNHPGWTMSSNKTKIEDFSTEMTTYTVVITKDGKKKVLSFDHAGNLHS